MSHADLETGGTVPAAAGRKPLRGILTKDGHAVAGLWGRGPTTRSADASRTALGLVGGGDMDSMLLYAVVTIAFLVLGILALGFGVDSRDGFEEDDWRRRR